MPPSSGSTKAWMRSQDGGGEVPRGLKGDRGFISAKAVQCLEGRIFI